MKLQLEVYSRCYKDQPLVIQGAGAGNDTTAAGVLADIVDIQDLFPWKLFLYVTSEKLDADTLFSIFMRLCIWDFRDLTFQNLAMHFANNGGLGDLAMHLAVKILHQGNAATVQTINC